MSLNLSDFRTVFQDDFTQDAALDRGKWAVAEGNANQFSFGGGLTLTGYQSQNWSPVLFQQLDNARSAGEGYGLFQFTGYVNAGQGAGIAFLLWRADNIALDPSTPNKATEIDALESWNGSKNGFSTVHFYNTGWKNNNGQVTNTISSSINLTTPHTYAIDWERGSLTFYVDGVQIYQDTTHAPLDYADGGSNEVMGALIEGETANVTTPTVQLHILSMSYGVPYATTTTAPVTSNSVTLPAGPQYYSAAAGTSVTAGAGNDTIVATAGGVFVSGSSGTVTFYGGTAASQLVGGTGSVAVLGGSGGGDYKGGSNGNNVLVSQGASGANTTLTGAGAGDVLFGSAQGNDLLRAAVGRESIVGGGGPTTIVGGGTAGSVIFTGNGPSTVFGGDHGGDTIVGGGSGAMNVVALNGDAVFGGTGSLNVQGSLIGGDSIVGGSGTLNVMGEGGNMLVVAGSSSSAIQVGKGAALIFTNGNTTVAGGPSWMELILGAGNTTVYEGGGPSNYEVIKGNSGGNTVINNFNAKNDKIDLYGYKHSDVHTSTAGGSTTLSLSDGTKIFMPGVSNLGNSVNGG